MAKQTDSEKSLVPYHLGIIMDGNRRWAIARNLPTLEGHRKGYDKLIKVGTWAKEAGVKVITVYAFSTENWNRSKKEISYLFKLLKMGLTKEVKRFQKEGIRLRVIGLTKQLPKDLQIAIEKAEDATKDLREGTLNLAINYGGQHEIVETVKKLNKQKKPITIDNISKNIWNAGYPDPDMIVRTSGEHRLSGFLTWQSVYAELLFIKTDWPDFTKKDFDDCLKEYARRNRRFGGN